MAPAESSGVAKGGRFDPKFRSFRIGMYAIYLVVVVVFSLLIAGSVVRSVVAMTPERHVGPAPTLPLDECLSRARALWAELDERRKTLGGQSPAALADARWMDFRLDWLRRHREAEAKCVSASSERAEVAQVFRRLDKTMDLYTTHAVQFAGEIGPTLDALQKAFDSAQGKLGKP